MAAVGLSAYLLIKGNGKKYVMEKLRQRGHTMRLEHKCAQIKKKIDQMQVKNPSIISAATTDTIYK